MIKCAKECGEQFPLSLVAALHRRVLFGEVRRFTKPAVAQEKSISSLRALKSLLPSKRQQVRLHNFLAPYHLVANCSY